MDESALNHIRIVLVEPAGPLNVGAIARIMKNMGLHQLVLVNPQCDPLGSEARQMAVHAADILEAAQSVGGLPLALEGCQRAIATTGRVQTTQANLESPRAALPWLLQDGPSPGQSALIFGPEDRGLSNDELKYAQRFLRIPTSEAYVSLNLAQAVGVCCYELHQSLAAPAPLNSILPVPLPDAPMEALEGFYQHLESLLLQIGYLYPHTADSRMKKFRQLLNRAYPSAAEVAMLRGILSQAQWALGQKDQDVV
jgi:tRNA/rRNA methyltransferase